MPKLFLSYNFADQQFVDLVYHMLKKQGLELDYWPEEGAAGDLNPILTEKIDNCRGMVDFLGGTYGLTQGNEVAHFQRTLKGRSLVVVELVDSPPGAFPVGNHPRIRAGSLDLASAAKVAREIVNQLRLTWVPEDGLPDTYIVAYEKEFLGKYAKADAGLMETLGRECGWTDWPTVVKESANQENPITDDSIGELSDDGRNVLLDARRSASRDGAIPLAFPEARPRKRLRYPLHAGGNLRVGILVSGGIAPGINAVIEGIVSRHTLYHERQQQAGNRYHLSILGYREGFKSLLNIGVGPLPLAVEMLRGVVEMGGSCLGTSRVEELLHGDKASRDRMLEQAVQYLRTHGINILYIIGGDGSMRVAHALWHYARRAGYDLSVVGIPKAMDNDILWVWQSFGFLSAVEEARQAILKIHTEVSSNPRVGIIQLFGSDSGFVASHAGYSTACDLVLIPEDPMTMGEIFAHVKKKLESRYLGGPNSPGPFAMIVMAETALPEGAEKYRDDERVGLSGDEQKALDLFLKDRRVRGQTPDELRRAGLKIISRVLEDRIQREMDPQDYWKDFRVVTSEPRHLIRSIPPSVTDVIFGERLGALAVDNAMAGYTDFMVSQWLTEYVLVPLPLVVLGRKRVPIKGVFWKSVVAKTGQTHLAKSRPSAGKKRTSL